MSMNAIKNAIKRGIPDELYLRYRYRKIFGKKLNIKNPLTFNEKIQWLKLYDRNPYYTDLVDKHKVKKIVGDLIGEEYIIPTLGIWNHPDEIDFSLLPNQFVLKCTHDSGGVVIVRDRENIDIKSIKNKLEKNLKNNFYYEGREWPYKNVEPKIIGEQYMANNSEAELCDYKFMCYSGKVYYIFTCTERYSESGLKVTFFDPKWNVLPFERKYPRSNIKIQKPACLEQMIYLAEKISMKIPFVRVDFYCINDVPYFGEITFYPGSGFERFSPEKWDNMLGEHIHIDEIKNL